MNEQPQQRKKLPPAPIDAEAAAAADANYKRRAVPALLDTRMTLAGEVTAARSNVERLAHFKAKGDRVMYSEAKERAAHKRMSDAVTSLDDFTKANPGLPA